MANSINPLMLNSTRCTSGGEWLSIGSHEAVLDSDFAYWNIHHALSKVGMVVQRIDKIHNRELQDRFKEEQDIVRKNKPPGFDLNIQDLYHGSSSSLTQLCNEGLDLRKSSKGAENFFGSGIYFSDCPERCRVDAEREGAPHPFIVRCQVILGESKVYESRAMEPQLTREPVRDTVAGKIIYFDSVKGSPGQHTEYVVYEKRRTLVQYIVHYTCTKPLPTLPPIPPKLSAHTKSNAKADKLATLPRSEKRQERRLVSDRSQVGATDLQVSPVSDRDLASRLSLDFSREGIKVKHTRRDGSPRRPPSVGSTDSLNSFNSGDSHSGAISPGRGSSPNRDMGFNTPPRVAWDPQSQRSFALVDEELGYSAEGGCTTRGWGVESPRGELFDSGLKLTDRSQHSDGPSDVDSLRSELDSLSTSDVSDVPRAKARNRTLRLISASVTALDMSQSLPPLAALPLVSVDPLAPPLMTNSGVALVTNMPATFTARPAAAVTRMPQTREISSALSAPGAGNQTTAPSISPPPLPKVPPPATAPLVVGNQATVQNAAVPVPCPRTTTAATGNTTTRNPTSVPGAGTNAITAPCMIRPLAAVSETLSPAPSSTEEATASAAKIPAGVPQLVSLKAEEAQTPRLPLGVVRLPRAAELDNGVVEEVMDFLISEFLLVTGVSDVGLARQYLRSNRMDIDSAVSAYFDEPQQ